MMSSRLFGTLGLVSLMSGFVACTSVDKETQAEVDRKVSAEKPTRTRGELVERGYAAWASSSALSRDQKAKMSEIQATSDRESLRIRNETTKTRSAMYKELAKGEYDDRVIDGFKTKLIKLSQERLDVTFKELASARRVLGPSEESRKYFEYMETIDAASMDGPRF